MMVWVMALVGVVVVGGTFYVINQVRYELRADALCVVYGSVCVRRVPYANIVSVERGAASFNEHYTRLSRDPSITLKLKKGSKGSLVPNFVINPPHTDEFIARLRAHLCHD